MHVSAVWIGHELIGNFTGDELISHVLSASQAAAFNRFAPEVKGGTD